MELIQLEELHLVLEGFESVAYGTSGDGTSMWVAVGDNTSGSSFGNIMYSYDGISWSNSVGGTSFSTARKRSGLWDQRGRNPDVGDCWK